MLRITLYFCKKKKKEKYFQAKLYTKKVLKLKLIFDWEINCSGYNHAHEFSLKSDSFFLSGNRWISM